MSDQFHYLFNKRSVYYYSRRIPIDIQEHYSTRRIQICLRTNSIDNAKRISKKLSLELEELWSTLRLNNSTSKLNSFLVNQNPIPDIDEAVELYFSLKGHDRPNEFFRTTHRAVEYLTTAIGKKKINAYTTADAARFRIWLMGTKGLSPSSVKRVISPLKALFALSINELGLDVKNPFTKVYIPPIRAKSRGTFSHEELVHIQSQCLKIATEESLVVALISDTGMRLSEALGLTKDDISITDSQASLVIRNHAWRRLKTSSSEREIPLVGASLEAAQILLEESNNEFLAPHYCNAKKTLSNLASSKINKWLKKKFNTSHVIHSFRHTFRDRLREIECPSELINELGGWSKSSIGEQYGNGYPLNVKAKWMSELKKKAPVVTEAIQGE